MTANDFYCSECGTAQPLGSGIITCRHCGSGGLRGYSDTPRVVRCTEPDCGWSGWDDGEVNDDLRRHLRREHDKAPEPEWRVAARARVAHLKVGTGTRSWSAACGQYLRSQGRSAGAGDSRCKRCDRRATPESEAHQ